MLATPRPLEEKLTLFWHGHFATGENKVRDYRMMLRQNEMFRAQRVGQPARSAGRDPEGSRRCSCISTTARTSRAHPERELRPRAARAVHDGRRQLHRARRARGRARVHRLDQRRPGVQVRRRRSTTSARRRSSAGRDRSTARTSSTSSSRSRSPASSSPRSSIGSSCARRSPPPVKTRAGPHVPRQRLSDEAAAEADLPLEGLLQPAVGTRRRSRARCIWSCPPTRRWACARCRRFPTSAA